MKNTEMHRAVTRAVSSCTGIVLLSLFTFSISAVSGQSPVQVGDKIRVTATRVGLKRSVGVLREMEDGVLVIDFGQAEGARRVRVDEIRRMEISFTRSSHVLTGLFIGLVVGAGAGAAEGSTRSDHYACSGGIPNICVHVTRKFKRVVGGVLGGLVGGSIGAFVGSFFKTDRWLPAFAKEAQVSVSPPLLAGGPGVAISVSF
jgi:hypothetical protein